MHDNLTAATDDSRSSRPIVGIVIFPDLLEDWLEHIDISFETFLDEMMGSWIFGYFESLKMAGAEPVMIAVSDQVVHTQRFVHRPTGTTICLLPATRLYRTLCRIRHAAQNFTFPGSRWMKGGLRILSEYVSTPFVSFCAELRGTRYASVLVQDYETARFDVAVLAGQLMGVPVYGTFQGAGAWRKLFYPIRSRTVKHSAGLIIAAQREAERVQEAYGLPSSKIARIYNPFDMASWKPVDRDQVRTELGIPLDAEVAIWHGRISIEQKGLDTLLAAWEQVCSSRPKSDLRLVLIGMGPECKELNAIIRQRKVRGVIHLNKWIHDTAVLRRYLGCADVFLFPSRYEGFAIAPMEAMACGLPIVASDASGIRDLLPEGWHSGGIVVPCDDPQAIAMETLNLLGQREWRAEIGERARRRIETMFSANAVGQQLAGVLVRHDAAEPLLCESTG